MQFVLNQSSCFLLTQQLLVLNWQRPARALQNGYWQARLLTVAWFFISFIQYCA
jgi:hypothetical protein